MSAMADARGVDRALALALARIATPVLVRVVAHIVARVVARRGSGAPAVPAMGERQRVQ